MTIRVFGLLLCSSVALSAFCGGAWVPAPGRGDVQAGFSRKTASSSWDASGESFANTTVRDGETLPHHHDFRYGYLSGEIGLFRRVSAHFLVTYLYGLEGPHHDLEKNAGLSDGWLGTKVQVREGAWPVAVSATIRTPVLYDRSGPYSRYITNAAGNRIDVSSEWRGVLKRDYSLTALVSHSFDNGAWTTLETGYTWREGAPADQVPFSIEAGFPLQRRLFVKGTLTAITSMGNDSPARPDDRFRSRADFNFNDASMLRASVSVIVPLERGVSAEAGYGQWLGGRSARQYREPYVSVGYRF